MVSRYHLKLFVFSLLALVRDSCRAGSAATTQEGILQTQLLANPDRLESPFSSSSEGFVSVYFYLANIYDYEYHWNTLHTASFITLMWNDVRLNWQTNSTFNDNGVQVLDLPARSIWCPRIQYHGFNYPVYATFEPRLIVDSMGMVGTDFPIIGYSPCQRWMDSPDTLSTDEYDCKFYFSVEDPNNKVTLNVGLEYRDNAEGTEGNIKEKEVYRTFFKKSSTYQLLYSKIKLLDSYKDVVPYNPSPSESKVFEVRLKIKLHHATRKMGFGIVLFCGLILAVVQFVPDIKFSEGDRQNTWAFYRLMLGFASLFTFMVVGFASDYVDNDYKFRILHLATALVSTTTVTIMYHSLVIILKNNGRISKESMTFKDWSCTDISDALLALVVLIVFIATTSVY